MNQGQVSGSFITTLLLAAVVISAFVIASINIVSDTATNYNLTVDTAAYEALNKSSEIRELAFEANEEFSGTNSSVTTETEIDSVVTTAGFSVIRIVSQAPDIYASILVAAANTMGIPYGYVQLAIAAIVIVFVGLAVYLALGRR